VHDFRGTRVAFLVFEDSTMRGGRALECVTGTGHPHRICAGLRFLPGLLGSLVFVGLLVPDHAAGSSLLAASAGAPDAAVAGSSIAEPFSPVGAQFSNPAGLAKFEEAAMGTGLGLAYGRGEVTADVPAGYHADNEVLVPFLNTFLVVPYGRCTFGASTLGTSGARFDYGARPSLGVPDGFFSESGMIGIPIGAGCRVRDDLWLGAEISPLYGSVHLRFSREIAEAPGTPTPFRFTLDGFGAQAMFGLTWKPHDKWAVGAAVKPPGRVWTDGDTAYSAGKQKVDLEIEVPAQVDAGVTYAFADRWKASYGLRFTDSSVLAKSTIRFAATPSANTAYLHGARDEWKHALGLEYAWSESWRFLGGVSKANGIVSSRGISPSSYDSRDWRLSGGVRWTGSRWTIDGAFVYVFGDSRRVDAGEALVFPGRFESEPAYLLSVMLTRKF
jgi:long-subunit fatty acid transport protein